MAEDGRKETIDVRDIAEIKWRDFSSELNESVENEEVLITAI